MKTDALNEKCPNCGEPSEDDMPRVYTCPTCGAEGFECCFPAGNGTECIDCEDLRED